MIRLATPEDLDLIFDLCREAHYKSLYSHIPYNEQDTRATFANCIVSGSVWVTDKVNGVLIGYLSPVWFNHNLTGANDLVFYVRDCERSAGVRLAKAYKQWGMEQADHVFMSISFGKNIERTERFYSRLGFVRMGGSYILKGD